MAKEQIASESSTPAARTKPPANPVRRLTLIVMAVGVVLFLYGIAADRITPYTAQALVQAYLVKIAPGRRLADERGEEVVVLAGEAIRGVAFGVILTALAQTFATGIALTAASVPQAGFLTAVALLLCLAQIGPILVVLPAIIWLFATGQTVPGIILVVIGVPAVLMDNFLRPVLIKRGADLPLLLIILGVIGGLLAFGVLGLFLGPVILAVTYTLLQHWVAEAKG